MPVISSEDLARLEGLALEEELEWDLKIKRTSEIHPLAVLRVAVERLSILTDSDKSFKATISLGVSILNTDTPNHKFNSVEPIKLCTVPNTLAKTAGCA